MVWRDMDGSEYATTNEAPGVKPNTNKNPC